MTDNYSVLIGADFFPTTNNSSCFSAGDAEKLFGNNLINILEDNDYRIFNLEGPLTDVSTPILKEGPVLRANRNTINGYTTINTSLLLLANNHILDHGEEGCSSTVDILNQNKISWIGVGKDTKQRSKAFYINNGSLSIGIYNCCEHEFSVVNEGMWGANEYDSLRTYNDISSAKRKCDFLIVAYHGGKERFRYPAPYLVDIFRKMADSGADVVIAQHTHCIGCYEEYNNSLLLYGQGNFLFGNADDEFYKSGLLVKLIFQNDSYRYEFIPVVKNGDFTRLADDSEKTEILFSLNERSRNIIDRNFVLNEYKKNADTYLDEYLLSLHGCSFFEKIFRKLNRKGYYHYISHRYKEKDLLCLYNYIRCEAHRDLLLMGLEGRLEESKNED